MKREEKEQLKNKIQNICEETKRRVIDEIIEEMSLPIGSNAHKLLLEEINDEETRRLFACFKLIEDGHDEDIIMQPISRLEDRLWTVFQCNKSLMEYLMQKDFDNLTITWERKELPNGFKVLKMVKCKNENDIIE